MLTLLTFRCASYYYQNCLETSHPKHPLLTKLRSPKNSFRHMFEALYAVIMLWRSPRKLHCVESSWWKSFLPGD